METHRPEEPKRAGFIERTGAFSLDLLFVIWIYTLALHIAVRQPLLDGVISFLRWYGSILFGLAIVSFAYFAVLTFRNAFNTVAMVADYIAVGVLEAFDALSPIVAIASATGVAWFADDQNVLGRVSRIFGSGICSSIGRRRASRISPTASHAGNGGGEHDPKKHLAESRLCPMNPILRSADGRQAVQKA